MTEQGYEDKTPLDDDAEFSEILSSLLELQDVLRQSEDPERIPFEYYGTITRLNQFSGREVCATGNLWVPKEDERGVVVGLKMLPASTVTGEFHELALDTISDRESLALGLQIILDTTSNYSPVHKSETTKYVFVPVDSSFVFPPNLDDVLPEDNDETALEIDRLILDEVINLDGIASFFQDSVSKMSELQQEMYLRYLNKVASFEHITALASVGLLIKPGNISLYQDLDQTYCAHGEFDSFTLIEYPDRTKGSTPKLVVLFTDEDDYKMGVLVDDIQEIELR